MTGSAVRPDDRARAGVAANWWLVVAMAITTYLAMLDMTVVTVALPTMTEDFGTSPAVSEWLVLGYLLPLVGFSLPAGRWVDSTSWRTSLFVAIAGFAAASVLVAASPTVGVAVAGRGLQGVFGALLFALAPAVASAAVPASARGRAMSVIATVGPLGAISGYGVGAVVLDGWGWPWAFYANVPVAAVSAAIVVCAMPAGAGALRRPSVDVLVEAVTLLVAAAALLGGLSLAAAHGAAWLLLSATAALPTAVWARSGPGRRAVRRLAVPAVRQPHVSLLLESFAFGAATFALPFLLAAGTLDSARSVALTLLALPAAAIVGSAFGGVLADRVQARLTAIVGTATLALGIATLASADASWGPSALLAGIALAGLGAGCFSGANQTIAMTAAGPGDAAGTGASTTIARQLGFAAGPATVTFIWALHDFAPAGLSAALLLAGVASAAAAAVLVPVPAPPNADVHLDERKIS